MSFEFFSEEFPSKVNFTIVLWPLEHCFTSICWILGVLLQDRVARGLAEDELRTENLISKRLPCYQLHHKVILILLPSSSIILSLCSGQPVVSFTCAFPVLYIFNMDVPDSSSCHMMESKIIAWSQGHCCVLPECLLTPRRWTAAPGPGLLTAMWEFKALSSNTTLPFAFFSSFFKLSLTWIYTKL